MRPAVISALAIGLVSASSCLVAEDSSVFIEGALPIIPDDCSVSAADQVFLASGILDLGAAGVGGYTSFLKVRTNLPATFNNQEVQQSQQQSPNFPDYGSVDNNVITMKQARLTLSIKGRVEQIAELATASQGALDCNGDTCTFGGDVETSASGTVFNVQQNLSSAQAIPTQLLPAVQATALRAILDDPATKLTEIFADPTDSLELQVEARLVGNTSGNGAVREVITLPFPFNIKLCLGCLNPSQQTCDAFAGAGTSAPVAFADDIAVCVAGQDIAVSQCVCANGAPVDDGGCQ